MKPILTFWCMLLCVSVAYSEDNVVLCDAGQGLALAQQSNPPLTQIERILEGCDRVAPHRADVQLLHGLLAVRKKDLTGALQWLEKAHATSPDNTSITLTLAVTLVRAKKWEAAELLYQNILQKTPENRSALLGVAGIYRERKQFSSAESIYARLLAQNPNDTEALNGMGWIKAEAGHLEDALIQFKHTLHFLPENAEAESAVKAITATLEEGSHAKLLEEGSRLRINNQLDKARAVYQQLLKKNTNDTDALNGLGWVELAAHNPEKAREYFERTRTLKPLDKEARDAIARLDSEKRSVAVKAPVSLCDADEGLMLLNEDNPPWEKINSILKRCDKNTPESTSTLMLHGLIQRFYQEYEKAIIWFQRAAKTAPPGRFDPLLELALTYEWNWEPRKALQIYQSILAKYPGNRGAELGQARTLRTLFRVPESIACYQEMLDKKPHDVDALNGLGESQLVNYDFTAARKTFNEVIQLSPENPQTLEDLRILNNATKHILGITGGYYAVPPQNANAINMYYFENLNATDGFTLFATHNSKQIVSDFFSGPALLPNNSLLIGYQRNFPFQYGWSASYDARQHDGLPFEHRVLGSANLFLSHTLEGYGGFRAGFPQPWNIQLYYAGMTKYTDFPVNVSFTGFWSHQPFVENISSYSLDFSKEYDNRLFYGFGPSYSPELQNWEVHGRIILPLFKNQAFVADYSHYFFNNSTFMNAGWRFYWA